MKEEGYEILNADSLAPERAIVPVGTYAIRIIHVEAYRRGIDGAVLLDEDDAPEKLTTKDGIPFWEPQCEILEGEYAGEVVYDRLYFDPNSSSRQRPVWMFEALGIIPTKAQCARNPALLAKRKEVKVKPEQLEDTYWMMTVVYSGVSLDADGRPRLNKAGEPFLQCKVAFRGYTRMDPALEEKYRAMASSQYPSEAAEQL